VTGAAAAVARAHAEEWAFVLAATARVAADLDLAEDCVQDAFAQALERWPAHGVPERPGAWLTTVAVRRALELRRRSATLQRKLPLLVPDEAPDTGVFPDDRLRLVFTCCHPALGREAQVALTLRLVCGLGTAEISRAFLVKETAMQARITRAKRKIASARIPYRLPGPADLPARVEAVLEVVHLVYTAGHTAAYGEDLTRPDLAARGTDLARMLHLLLPEDPEVAGLLALVLLSESRAAARTDAHGRLAVLAEQDRSRWDGGLVAEGLALVRASLSSAPGGRFALMAAAAAVHAEAPRWEDTDWRQLLGIYDLLVARWPSPVVALNRAVALSYTDGPAAALAAIAPLEEEPGMATYPYLAATRADLLRRLGDNAGAAAAYEEARLLTGNATEAEHLSRRIAELP
jgi:RNA polymerase sigma-70 factor (ECF subfamily)